MRIEIETAELYEKMQYCFDHAHKSIQCLSADDLTEIIKREGELKARRERLAKAAEALTTPIEKKPVQKPKVKK